MPEINDVVGYIRNGGNETIASSEEANTAPGPSQRISGFASFRAPSGAQHHEPTDIHTKCPGFSFSSYKPPPDHAPAAGQGDEKAQRGESHALCQEIRWCVLYQLLYHLEVAE